MPPALQLNGSVHCCCLFGRIIFHARTRRRTRLHRCDITIEFQRDVNLSKHAVFSFGDASIIWHQDITLLSQSNQAGQFDHFVGEDSSGLVSLQSLHFRAHAQLFVAKVLVGASAAEHRTERAFNTEGASLPTSAEQTDLPWRHMQS